MKATEEGFGNSDDWKSTYNKVPLLLSMTYWVSSKVVSKIYINAPNTQNKIRSKYSSLMEYEN